MYMYSVAYLSSYALITKVSNSPCFPIGTLNLVMELFRKYQPVQVGDLPSSDAGKKETKVVIASEP